MKEGLKNGLLNGVLGVLIVAVGAVCLYPPQSESVGSESAQPYRTGNSPDGVSLTFNVYEGRDVVYGILDVLEKHGAKCTFYIGGCWADDNADCVKEIFSRGHEIGNHGYFHKDHAKLSQKENEREIGVCNEFLRLCTGVTPTLFAPPSGSFGTAQLAACEALNMKTVLWSKDTIDWRDRDSSIVYKRATKNIKAGDIVLMHPYESTLAALDKVLIHYENAGLRAVTVSENLQNGG